MIIQFQGVLVSVPNPSIDGAKAFHIPDELWELWKEKKHICKAHGFYIEKRDGEWVGIYRPFTRFGEGTKRVQREKSEQEAAQETLQESLYVPEIFDIGF